MDNKPCWTCNATAFKPLAEAMKDLAVSLLHADLVLARAPIFPWEDDSLTSILYQLRQVSK